MASYLSQLQAVQTALWNEGCDAGSTLQDVLSALGQAALPHGVTRLPAANLTPGPHLERQFLRSDTLDRNIVAFQRKASTPADLSAPATAPFRV